ncbi:hypothetical protein ACVR1I_03865 [Streptococcus cameli]
MKSGFKLAIVSLSLLSLGGCSVSQKQSKTTEETPAINVESGAFEKAESVIVTPQMTSLVKKATEDMTGATYEPVAYLASQVVAGTNHLILCKVTTASQEEVTTFDLVTIYEDLDGNAEIIEVDSSDIEVDIDGLGAYQSVSDMTITNELQDSFDQATEGMTGADYQLIALLAEQVVAGTNSLILVEVSPSTEKPESTYELVELYQPLEGKAEIIATHSFNLED